MILRSYRRMMMTISSLVMETSMSKTSLSCNSSQIIITGMLSCSCVHGMLCFAVLLCAMLCLGLSRCTCFNKVSCQTLTVLRKNRHAQAYLLPARKGQRCTDGQYRLRMSMSRVHKQCVGTSCNSYMMSCHLCALACTCPYPGVYSTRRLSPVTTCVLVIPPSSAKYTVL